VPLKRRGSYFGLRSTILGAVTMAANFGAGKLYDVMKSQALQQQAFAIIFGAAAFTAVIAGIILSKQWEPPLTGEKPLPISQLFRLPFANRDFRRLLLFFVLWSMATAVAGPFFAAHMIKNLHMPFAVIAYYSIIAGILNFAFQPLWGRIIDRLGNKPVMIFNMLGIFSLPLFWLFTTPDFYLPIWIDAFISGLVWPGFALATFNLLLVTAPEDEPHRLSGGPEHGHRAGHLRRLAGRRLAGRQPARFQIYLLGADHHQLPPAVRVVLHLPDLPAALGP